MESEEDRRYYEAYEAAMHPEELPEFEEPAPVRDLRTTNYLLAFAVIVLAFMAVLVVVG